MVNFILSVEYLNELPKYAFCTNLWTYGCKDLSKFQSFLVFVCLEIFLGITYFHCKRRRKWELEKDTQLTPVFLPRESHGQWSLVGYSPQGRKSWT